jgi:hypothetical protein
MNTVVRTELRVLVSLFVASHNPEGGWLSRDLLAKDYATDLDPRMFKSIIWELHRRRLVELDVIDDQLMACLKDEAYADALKTVLEILEADEFKVDWKRERILTDAKGDKDALLGVPEGWMVLTLEPKKSPTPPPVKVPIPAGVLIPSQAVSMPKPSEGPWTKAGVVVGVIAIVVSVILAIYHFS